MADAHVLPELAEVSMDFGGDHAASYQAWQHPKPGQLPPPQPRNAAGMPPPPLPIASIGSGGAAGGHPGFTPVGPHTGRPVTFQGPSDGFQEQGVALQGGAPPAHLAYALAQQAAGYEPDAQGAEEAVDILGDGQQRAQPQQTTTLAALRQTTAARVAEISHFIGNWDAVINIAEVRLSRFR